LNAIHRGADLFLIRRHPQVLNNALDFTRRVGSQLGEFHTQMGMSFKESARRPESLLSYAQPLPLPEPE
jgi:hypothetical protein